MDLPKASKRASCWFCRAMASEVIDMLEKAVVATKGEKYNREFVVDVETKCIAVTHVTQCEGGKKVHMSYVLDLSKLSEEEILGHAARNCNIQWIRPSLFRTKSAEQVMEMNGQTIDASDHRPTKERGPVDPIEAAVKALMKLGMTREQAIGVLEAQLKEIK